MFELYLQYDDGAALPGVQENFVLVERDLLDVPLPSALSHLPWDGLIN